MENQNQNQTSQSGNATAQNQGDNASFTLNLSQQKSENNPPPVSNPLNTGNGNISTNTQQTEEKPSEQPHTIKLEELAQAETAATAVSLPKTAQPSVPSQEPLPAETPSIQLQQTTQQIKLSQSAETATSATITSKEKSFKKYIIIGIAAILFITIAFTAYSFFFKNPKKADETEASPALTNKLSDSEDAKSTQSSEKKGKLEEVVNELKDAYSTPPALNINIPDTDETEADTPIENKDATEIENIENENPEIEPVSESTPQKILR